MTERDTLNNHSREFHAGGAERRRREWQSQPALTGEEAHVSSSVSGE